MIPSRAHSTGLITGKRPDVMNGSVLTPGAGSSDHWMTRSLSLVAKSVDGAPVDTRSRTRSPKLSQSSRGTSQRAAQELPAYRIQQAWLTAMGLDPDVNWVAVALQGGCTPRDFHPD